MFDITGYVSPPMWCVIKDQFLQDISDCADKATTIANAIRDKAATIILEAEARANVISADRAQALRTYDEQWTQSRFILRSPVASALRADYPKSTFSRILGTLVTGIKVSSS